MAIKRIFTDMDGTLLNSQGRVSADNAQAVRASEIPVTLVSARAPMEMKEAIEALDLTGPQVAFNGGLIYEMEEGRVHPLHTDIIPKQTVQLLLKSIRRAFPEVSLSYYDLTHWYCDTIDKGIRFEYDLTRQAPTLVNDSDRFLLGQDNTFKIMLLSFEEEEMQDLLFTRTGQRSPTYRSIMAAYREVYGEAVPVTVLEGIATEEDGYEAAKKLARERNLDCIFANGDDVAAGIFRYYQQQPLPFLCGQENQLTSQLLGISTIDHKSYDLGRECFRQAISDERRTLVLQSEFIER
ncbi:HAD hydrolase family protein [Streptococcus panodentis]|uniref:Uncharacterized protein n=1 Tax=Streptococcus panodentis TaxID=1581472 RepID=A0ABS5AZE7_9STRE|nr:HAD hydrolase family protein [Streptococcus panodentis]MBP2621946.1 hypothetical protein [Streptococcus panodentis]